MNKKTLLSMGLGILAALVIIIGLRLFSGGGTAHTLTPERAKESVKLLIHLRETSKDFGLIGSGSAFVVNSEGSLITNAHVVCREEAQEGKPPKIIYPDTNDVYYIVYSKQRHNRRVVVMQRAQFEVMDLSRDLAWLRVAPDRSSFRPLPLAASARQSDEKYGSEVTALGFPGFAEKKDEIGQLLVNMVSQHIRRHGQPHVGTFITQDRIELPWNSTFGELLSVWSSKGSIHQIRKKGAMKTGLGTDATMGIISHSAELQGGMSGGPLLNAQGHVVGVNFASNVAIGNASDEKGKNIQVKTNATINNLAIDVSELRHFLTTQSMYGDKPFVDEHENPDSLINRMRAHLSTAKPYEVALAAIGSVFALGAVITLIILLLPKKPLRRRALSGGAYDLPMPPPPPSADDDSGSTVPFGAPADGRESETDTPTLPWGQGDAATATAPSLVLSGQDAEGVPLRFRITQSELLSQRNFLIGKSSKCHLRLPQNDYISRQQASLLYECAPGSQEGVLYLKDENARNTTMVNGEPLRGRCPLEPGDVITMGPVSLTLSIE